MVRSLNNYFLILCFCFSLGIEAQEERINEKDFQNKEAFKKFQRRSNKVGAWQIQNLKFGAIVVRLQNDKRKIDGYVKTGDLESAFQAQAEMQYRNRAIMKAALAKIDFCKVYFIYSQNSDSVLYGSKKGIFLDSSLKIKPDLAMSESYYVILDEDYLFYSTIGFVPEDSAKYAVERGHTNGGKVMVFKNKYGHQLKKPFPYKNSSSLFNIKKLMVTENAFLDDGKSKVIQFRATDAEKYYENIMENVNAHLRAYYQKSQGEQVNDEDIKPFLY